MNFNHQVYQEKADSSTVPAVARSSNNEEIQKELDEFKLYKKFVQLKKDGMKMQGLEQDNANAKMDENLASFYEWVKADAKDKKTVKRREPHQDKENRMPIDASINNSMKQADSTKNPIFDQQKSAIEKERSKAEICQNTILQQPDAANLPKLDPPKNDPIVESTVLSHEIKNENAISQRSKNNRSQRENDFEIEDIFEKQAQISSSFEISNDRKVEQDQKKLSPQKFRLSASPFVPEKQPISKFATAVPSCEQPAADPMLSDSQPLVILQHLISTLNQKEQSSLLTSILSQMPAKSTIHQNVERLRAQMDDNALDREVSNREHVQILEQKVKDLNMKVEELKLDRNQLVEENRKQLQKIRHLEQTMEQYSLQRQTVEKERFIEMQFQSTYEKERIDSNHKLSSGGNKGDLSSFKKLTDLSTKQLKNAFKIEQSFTSRAQYQGAMVQEQKRLSDLNDTLRTDKKVTSKNLKEETHLYNQLQQAPKKQFNGWTDFQSQISKQKSEQSDQTFKDRNQMKAQQDLTKVVCSQIQKDSTNQSQNSNNSKQAASIPSKHIFEYKSEVDNNQIQDDEEEFSLKSSKIIKSRNDPKSQDIDDSKADDNESKSHSRSLSKFSEKREEMEEEELRLKKDDRLIQRDQNISREDQTPQNETEDIESDEYQIILIDQKEDRVRRAHPKKFDGYISNVQKAPMREQEKIVSAVKEPIISNCSRVEDNVSNSESNKNQPKQKVASPDVMVMKQPSQGSMNQKSSLQVQQTDAISIIQEKQFAKCKSPKMDNICGDSDSSRFQKLGWNDDFDEQKMSAEQSDQQLTSQIDDQSFTAVETQLNFSCDHYQDPALNATEKKLKRKETMKTKFSNSLRPTTFEYPDNAKEIIQDDGFAKSIHHYEEEHKEQITEQIMHKSEKLTPDLNTQPRNAENPSKNAKTFIDQMEATIRQQDGVELSQVLFDVEMEMDDDPSLSIEIDIEWYKQKAIELVNEKSTL